MQTLFFAKSFKSTLKLCKINNMIRSQKSRVMLLVANVMQQIK
jgi:hypothetical protein